MGFMMNVVQPNFILPNLHKDARYISFENTRIINKIYSEIMGVESVSHFSINVVNNKTEEMSVISCNPSIIYNLCSDELYKFNGSISPSFYKFRDIYTWDETYDTRYASRLKNTMEKRNGIEQGVVLIKRLMSHTLLYSFATKKSGPDLLERIKDDREKFYAMGDHCFDQISDIYQNYSPGNIIAAPPKKKVEVQNKANVIDLNSYGKK